MLQQSLQKRSRVLSRMGAARTNLTVDLALKIPGARAYVIFILPGNVAALAGTRLRRSALVSVVKVTGSVLLPFLSLLSESGSLRRQAAQRSQPLTSQQRNSRQGQAPRRCCGPKPSLAVALVQMVGKSPSANCNPTMCSLRGQAGQDQCCYLQGKMHLLRVGRLKGVASIQRQPSSIRTPRYEIGSRL